MATENTAQDARIERTLAASAIGVLEWHIDTGLVTANEVCAELFGFTPAPGEHILKALHDAVLAPEWPAFERVIWEAAETGKNIRHGFRVRGIGDGPERRLVMRVLYHPEAEIVTGIIADVTSRDLGAEALRASEEALRASEERLAFALDATTDGVWDWDLPSGNLVVNARWYTMLGYEPNELPPTIQTWQMLSHPDDVPTAYGQLDAHGRGELPQVEFEMRMRRKDGSWCWILNRAKIVAKDAAGQPLRVVGTHTDISARRMAQEQLTAQAAVLDSVLSNIPLIIDIIRPDGFIEYINRAGEQTLGWTLDELQTSDAMSAIYPDPAYRQKVFASIGEASTEWGDWVARARDGHDVTISWMNVQLADGRRIGIGLDVTQLRKTEQAQEQLERQMQQAQKLESLGLLAGGIAHDFNNLLVGVLGNASLAEESLPADSPVAPLIADVRSAATRAAELTRQLLAYAGKGRFIVERLDVSALVIEMTTLLKSAVSKQASFIHDLTPGLPPVEADATQLRQVVMNLITNASDALDDHPGTITLRATLARPDAAERAAMIGGNELAAGPCVCIEVTDTGVGMGPETIDRIFDPFFTTKETGHGLGLAATLGIIRSHRGAITVRSTPGQGTQVRVYLPAVEALQRRTPALGVRAISQVTGSGSILLADDETAVREVARRALERAGFEVVACADGRQAVDRFTEDPTRWRGVVLDLTMPFRSGGDALLAMRAIRSDIPAILCSGYAAEELKPEVRELDGIRFLQKPFTATALALALGELIGATSQGATSG